jgi:hypothetical protein
MPWAFGFSPKISTTVENTVENGDVVIELNSKIAISGLFCMAKL